MQLFVVSYKELSNGVEWNSVNEEENVMLYVMILYGQDNW